MRRATMSGKEAPRLAPSDQELAAKVLTLLRSDVYRLAKEASVYYELQEGRRSREAAYELRDALDHLARACEPGIDAGEREAGVVAAEEHLMRAALEPIEAAAEERLTQAMKRQRLLWLKRIVYEGLPSSDAIAEQVSRIVVYLKDGRQSKSRKGSVRHAFEAFVKAHTSAATLCSDLTPQRYTWLPRALGLLGAAALGAALQLLIQRFFL